MNNNQDQITIIRFLTESNAIEGIYDTESVEQAFKAWEFIIKKDNLTASDILRLHAILMKGKLDYSELGSWRKEPVWIGGKEARPWYAVPDLIDQWLIFTNTHTRQDCDEMIFQDDHVDFEAIHPFVDGNGRVGRILFNWQRVKAGFPIFVIHESEKQDYYLWFY